MGRTHCTCYGTVGNREPKVDPVTETQQPLGESADKPQPLFVTCLSIDLIGSTAAGFRRTTLDNDRFNIALAQQIQPHLRKLGLQGTVVKFTGDGWLVMTEGAALVPNLCCLATVMAHSFRRDMAHLIGKSEDDIPGLRLAICGGRDISVTVSEGTRDFVGDSARRAVRAGAGRPENQILINSLVYDCVFRDFQLERVEWDARPTGKGGEEPLVLYELGRPTREAGEAPDAAACFIYTFDVTERRAEKVRAIERAARKLAADLQQAEAEPARQPMAETRRWNKLLSSAPDLETGQRWYDRMRADGVPPDVVTYSTLINLSADLDTATQWYHRMRADGVLPDLVTYSTLINLSPDQDTATQWYHRMRADGVLTDLLTYNTLIRLSADLDTATHWYDRMRADGVLPDVVSYNTLINLSTHMDTASRWYKRMRADGVLPNVVTYSTLINLSADSDTANQWYEQMRAAGVRPDVVTYSTLINLSADLDTANQWYDRMRADGILPDVVTYSTLIRLSGDLDTASQWYERMRADGVLPNVVTYSTLINLSGDLDTASQWYERMRANGVLPDVVTYSTLIRLSGDPDTASQWYERMRTDGIPPNQHTYEALFARDLTAVPPEQLLAWYNRHPNTVPNALDAAIARYRKSGAIEHALRIALERPDLPAARPLFRHFRDRAISYYRGLVENPLHSAKAHFCLGLIFLQNTAASRARESLAEALRLTDDDSLAGSIEEILRQLDA